MKVRLTESQLHRVIKESVKRILRESSDRLLQNARRKADDDKFKLSMKKYTWNSWPNVDPSFSDEDEKLLRRRTRQKDFFNDEANRRRDKEEQTAEMEGKSLYFYIPTNSCDIKRIFLTPEEYRKRKENGELIFDNGLTAHRIAFD